MSAAQTTSRIAEAQQKEFYAWREVCRLLQAGGAVTEADCMQGARGLQETYGQILLDAIREWGKAKQDLGGAREEKGKNGISQLSLV